MLFVDAGLGGTSALNAVTQEPSGSWSLLHAPTLRRAYDVLTARSFDCVVVDLDLPGVDRAETWHQLRRHAGEAALLALADDHDHHPDHLGRELADDLVVRTELVARDLHRTLSRTVRHVRVSTALQRAEASARVLSAIVDASPDAVFSKSADGTITSWNRGAQQLYGWSAEEIVGQHVTVLHPPGVEEYAPIMAMLRRGESVRALETVRRAKDGRLLDVALTVCPVLDDRGELAGASVVARNISDRRELETELVRAFMHDGLTGLPNRAFLVDRLSQLLARAAADRVPVAVLFLDLDRFKRINEAQGHFAGDRVLGEVATRLSRVAGPDDTLARLGGDEFVLVCPETDMEAAAGVAQRLIDALRSPMRVEGRAVHISASIGIAVCPPLDADAEALLRHADAAMYEAKSRGRSRSQIFDVSFAERSREQLQLGEELREALATDRLELHYQPVLDLTDHRVVGVEALARWDHPTRGAVSPETFVTVAENSGFVAELDQWVLRRACRDAHRGRAAGLLPPDARVAINLSARSIGDPGLAKLVAETLESEGLPASWLVLEITETALMQDITAARRCLNDLRELGVGIALDDFGTGYSSLSFLRDLPVTQVKIDRSFITNIAGNGEDLLITQSIINLARGLGLETVAEGVETEVQLTLLKRLGCASAQGHLWSPAVPIDLLTTHDGHAVHPELSTLPVRSGVVDRAPGLRWPRSRRRNPTAPAS
ncbi:putative bifunctional diguanylate cyclase/phosphodiesterase [Nocardioides sp. MAHUQ-72]